MNKLNFLYQGDLLSLKQLMSNCQANLGTILFNKIISNNSGPSELTETGVVEMLTGITRDVQKAGLEWDLVSAKIFTSEYLVSEMFFATLPSKNVGTATIVSPAMAVTTDLTEEELVQQVNRPMSRPYIHPEQETAEHTGGSVNYYKVDIKQPVTEGIQPYTAECLDVALALGMNIPEFNMFKAIWRTAAERTLGKAKAGNNAKYDAEKTKFFADLNLRQYKEM